MRTLRLTAAALALFALLAIAPALLLAAEGEPPPEPPAVTPELVPLEEVNTPPSAAFEAAPDADPTADTVAVAAGETVTLDATSSSDAEGAVARFEWDLDGDGVYESDAGAGAVLQHAFATPGELDLGLRVTDAGGAVAEVEKRLTVAAPLEPAVPEVQDPPAEEPAAAAPESPKPRRAKAAQHGDEPRSRKQPEARDAASSGVTIKDFSFAPRSVSVNVGDTVTWTNDGDEVHTATANDGSFDTGNLSTGESGSHTFQKAGTFSYICKPHPFMKGTVTVAGAGGGGSGGSGGDAAAAGTDDGGAAAGDSGDAGAGGGLATTGSDLLPLTGLALIMLMLGSTLQRRLPEGPRTRP